MDVSAARAVPGAGSDQTGSLCQPDTEVTIGAEASTCGHTVQTACAVCVCLCHCVWLTVCNLSTREELLRPMFDPENTSSPNSTHTHAEHAPRQSADEMFSEGLLLQWRWHKPFNSYLWPSIPYNTHSLTGSRQPARSLPRLFYSKAWFPFIKSVSSPPFHSAGCLFVSNPYPSFSPGLLFQLCSSSSHLCLVPIILSPPFSCSTAFATHCLPLLFASFSQCPQSSPRSFSLSTSILCHLYGFPLCSLSSLKWPLTLCFLLAVLSLSFSPSLFSQLFLLYFFGVRSLWRPGSWWDIYQEKGLENKLGDVGGWGAARKDCKEEDICE